MLYSKCLGWCVLMTSTSVAMLSLSFPLAPLLASGYKIIKTSRMNQQYLWGDGLGSLEPRVVCLGCAGTWIPASTNPTPEI